VYQSADSLDGGIRALSHSCNLKMRAVQVVFTPHVEYHDLLAERRQEWLE
jgi:hypothetical protein